MSKYTPEQLDSIFEQIKEIIGDASNKLRAIELRLFIDQLYPREEEVNKQILAEMNQRFVGLNDRIRKVEECLGIDFNLDQLEPKHDDLDYYFIQDEFLREKATAYYREMLRYQYATRNHKRCFGEFCRLAIIQAELMLNYFFADERKFELVRNDIDKIAKREFDNDYKKWINNHREGPKPVEQDYKDQMYYDKKGSVPKINYSDKSKTFTNKYLYNKYIWNSRFQWSNKFASISIWTNNMRNRKSHGGSTSIDPYEGNYLTEEELLNLENWKNELKRKTKDFSDTHEEEIIFENSQLKPDRNDWSIVPYDIKKLYNSYNELYWIFHKPFDDVHTFLRLVAATCAKELEKNE